MLLKSLRLAVYSAAVLVGLGTTLTAHAGSPDCPNCPGGGVGGGGRVSGMGHLCHLGANGELVCRNREYGQPDLFANYFAPGTCGGVPAQLYVAPLPVPPNVGHTYYTYQPFMPHELLYQHNRVYHRYYEGGRGMTRTSVRWW